MGLRFEAWTLPTSATFKKLFDLTPLAGSTGVRSLSGWSDATLQLPASYDHTELISATAGSWIRVYRGTTLIDEFLAERVATSLHRPGVTSVSGPQRNALVEKCAIYPYNYPNDTPGAQDWHWGLDENALRNGSGEDNPLGLANSGFETAIPSPWWAGAVAGTSANLSVVTTAPRTGTYHALIEALRNEGGMSTSVRVYPGRDYRFAIYGRTPSGSHAWQLGATGSAAIQVLSGDRVIEFSGHFAGTYEAQADDTYTTTYTQHELRFKAAPDQTSTQLNVRYIGGAPTQNLYVDDIEWEGFGVGIDGWDYSPQVTDFQVAQDVAATDGSYHFRVIAPPNAGVFQGVRTFVPGETVTFEVDMRGPAARQWTVELRDLTGTLIHQTPVILNTGAWTTVTGTATLPTFLPGDGTVQFWLVNRHSAESTLYFDNAKLFSGLPAATYTEILRLLIEAAQARGTFTFLDLDFTDAVDTAGTALSPISFSAFFGANGHLGQVLRDGHMVGYEWRIVAKATPAGALTHDLQVWAPNGGPGDLTASGGGPSVLGGGKVEQAELVTRIPGFTALLVHGAEHLRLEDTDATAVTNMGRWERIIDAEAVTSLGTLQAVADASFGSQTKNRDAVTAVVLESDQTVPLVDYTEGNVIWWQLPGLTDKVAKQVRRVGWTHGDVAKFELQGSRILTGEAALAAATALLLDEFRRRRTRRRASGASEIVSAGGGGGAPTLVVAASDALHSSKARADFICTGTDDQTTINTALDLLTVGGTLWLTEGTYNCTWPAAGAAVIRLSAGINGVSIRGMGPQATTINVAGSPTASHQAVIDISGAGNHISDLWINDNQAGTTPTDGIVLGDAYQTVERVGMFTRGYGIVLGNTFGARIDSVWVDGTAGTGIGITGAANYTTITNSFIGAFDTATTIAVDIGAAATHTVVHGCRIDTSGIGIFDAGQQTQISSCSVNAVDACIQITGDFTRITDNYLENAAWGIEDLGTGYPTITGNHLAGMLSTPGTEWAIRIIGTGAVVADNVIENSTGGLEVNTTDPYVRVTGNTIEVVGNTPGIRYNTDGGHVTGNLVKAFNHGIEILGHDTQVEGNTINLTALGADNTYDGIFVDGDADRNFIHGNRIIGTTGATQPRHAININASTCDANVYVGNHADPNTHFGSARYADAGTGTINTWPGAAAPQGDNI